MSSTTASFFSSLLRNCVPLTAIFPAKQLHAQILVHGFRSNVTLQTDLLLVYSRSGVLTIARKVFDKMPKRNMHSWNILLSSYVNNSMFDDALSFFHEFMKVGLRPDHFTLPPAFKACAGIRDFYLGVSLHSWVIRLGFEEYVVVASSALDYYVKCGNLVDAKSVFERISSRDSVTWNSMISGFARAGTFSDALDCFRNMLEEGVEIDSMMIPTIVWGALLAGCVMHKNVVIGEIAARQLFELEPENPSNYIALCGIYDSVGMRDGVKIIRAMIKALKMQKTSGCSWIIIAGRVHKFYQGTLLDPHGRMMYDTLDGAIKDPLFPEILGERSWGRVVVVVLQLVMVVVLLLEEMEKGNDEAMVEVTKSSNSWMLVRLHVHLLAEGMVFHLITTPTMLSAFGREEELSKGKESHAKVVKK
ncbi:Pentatricopeptide repeat [Dillenia turbinata]|uniref:Pentatricopeptide repeat n=1 Tax=Dillenia turbinata TaxID=194707 RepID=A0AAN8V7S6_9MAGN